MPTKNPRIHPYISEDCYVRLKALAKQPGHNESEIVDRALAAFFSKEYEDKRDGALIRRLDRMSRQFEDLKRKQIISSEAFVLFVRHYLTVIPPLDEASKSAAQSQGQARYEGFLESLKAVLLDSDNRLFSITKDIIVDESAFFTDEELHRLHDPKPDRVSKIKEAPRGKAH